MAGHKGPASLRPRCTRCGSSVAAIPVYLCQGDTSLFQGEECELLDGIVDTIVYQVAVNFPQACVKGVSRICLSSVNLLC
jgi:hypothetical protein